MSTGAAADDWLSSSELARDGRREAEILSRAWFQLRLSIRAPNRFPPWNALLITAASDAQADLYSRQLEAARHNGHIAAETIVLAVPDREGKRIGSGGATLGAIRALRDHLGESSSARLPTMKVLLVHAGGDSKRLPWANPCGKPFVPFPLLAGDDPDGPPLTLFDHILAVSALALQVLPSNDGALFIMTGDVLPCFNASRIRLPSHGALVVTAAVPLDVASRHGKPSVGEMVEKGALCGTGGALLDTGIYAVCGDTWRDLIGLATSEEDLLGELLASGEELSLYEELAAAWVPACHAWLSTRPLGSHLLAHLSSHSLFHHCADDLSFLHFGTSSEYLHHMSLPYTGRMPRRHLSAVAAPTDCHVAQSAALISSHVPPGACVGEGSVVSDSWLVRGTRIGDRCVVIGVDTAAAAAAESASSTSASAELDSSRPPTPIITSVCPLVLPSHMCLWQVPLKGGREVTLCCGVDDNPKLSFSGGGSFCGRPWRLWLRDRGLKETDIWPDYQGRPVQPKQDLWNALLFPILPTGTGLRLAMWLLGSFAPSLTQAPGHSPSQALSQQYSDTWRRSDRTSLALLHHLTEMQPLPLGATVTVTLPVRLDIAGGWSDTPPWSLERCGTVLNMAVLLEGKRPVGATVTVVKEPGVLMEDDSGASLHIPDPATIPTHLSPQEPFVVVKAALLVTRISTLLSPSSSSSSCVGLHIRTWADVPRGSGLGTSSVVAAALVRALLLLVRGGGRRRSGAEQAPKATDGAPETTERTPAKAPEKAPEATEEAPEVTDEEVSRLVLLQEQRMGTGGGWQDQVGGLYPGVKCTTSLPTRPIRLVVDPLPLIPEFRSALQQRLVVVFVGQVRLARNVLKNVVTRYLQRDTRLISTIQRLTDLAEIGRRAISTADLELLGRVLSHTWDFHQELDPHCSNPHVDALLAAVKHLSCGAKLAGAGGGGFAMIMGRSEEAAEEIKGILRGMGEPVRVYDWAVAV
ncbi:unnamed protein product [Closterium sp. Yama58-4]|nr:unnamed protein product [Closterium sp. Yama58-4]